VFASGGSYGGYLVAWMNGHVRRQVPAYVCHAGLLRLGFHVRRRFVPVLREELGAWYWEDFSKVEAQNARAAVKRMQTPTLVIHGALDYRVPDSQGLQYYNTLKAKKYQRVCFTSRTRTTGSSSRRTHACGTASSSPGQTLDPASIPFTHALTQDYRLRRGRGACILRI